MAPKEAKPVLSDVDTSKKQLASRLSVAAQSMRQCATFVESVAQTVAKLPLDADSIEALQELLGDAPIKIGKRKARDDDGEGTKRKRVTKPKDPNAPKRPASAYILFQNEVRAKLKEQNPELPQSELLSLIGRRWTAMSQQEKERYTSENTKAKEKYQSAKAAYDAQGVPADIPVVADTPAPTKKAVVVKKKAKSPPKSAPIIETSSDASEESGSEESSVEDEIKAAVKNGDDDDDDDDDDDVSSEEDLPPPPIKKTKTTNAKKVKA